MTGLEVLLILGAPLLLLCIVRGWRAFKDPDRDFFGEYLLSRKYEEDKFKRSPPDDEPI